MTQQDELVSLMNAQSHAPCPAGWSWADQQCNPCWAPCAGTTATAASPPPQCIACSRFMGDRGGVPRASTGAERCADMQQLHIITGCIRQVNWQAYRVQHSPPSSANSFPAPGSMQLSDSRLWKHLACCLRSTNAWHCRSDALPVPVRSIVIAMVQSQHLRLLCVSRTNRHLLLIQSVCRQHVCNMQN